MHERWFRASQAKSDNGGGSIAPFLSISANLTGFYRSCHFHISRSFACFLSRNKPNGGTRMSSTTNRTDVKLLSRESILSPVVCPVHFCMMSLRKADSYLEKGAFPRSLWNQDLNSCYNETMATDGKHEEIQLLQKKWERLQPKVVLSAAHEATPMANSSNKLSRGDRATKSDYSWTDAGFVMWQNSLPSQKPSTKTTGSLPLNFNAWSQKDVQQQTVTNW